MEKKKEFELKQMNAWNVSKFKIPKMFEDILSEFIAQLIKNNPENIDLFSYNYFNEKLQQLIQEVSENM